MTDKELLELAATAAGLTFRGVTELIGPDEMFVLTKEHGRWNPLTDGAAALRLAVKLRMCVESWGAGAAAVVIVNDHALIAEPHYGDDPERATRRAIVRAAAEIGKSK